MYGNASRHLLVTVGRKGFSFLSNGLILRRWAYPQSCAMRMTARSAEGAKGDFASAEAGFRACGHDQRTEPVWRLCDRPLETFGAPLISLYRTQRWQVAAALSAAVTTTKQHGTALTSQAEPSPKKRTPPNASRSSGGSAREGLLSEKPPPSHTHPPYFGQICSRLS